MHENVIQKKQKMLIHQTLTNLKSNVNKLYIDKLKTVPINPNNLESKVYERDIDKLKTVPVDLKKLTDVVEKAVFVEKALHDQSATKVNAIGTSELVKKRTKTKN